MAKVGRHSKPGSISFGTSFFAPGKVFSLTDVETLDRVLQRRPEPLRADADSDAHRQVPVAEPVGAQAVLVVQAGVQACGPREKRVFRAITMELSLLWAISFLF